MRWSEVAGPYADAVPPLRFEILHEDPTTLARVGRVVTPHGSYDTPAFMPVGTRASVKGLFPHLVAQTGSQIILNNTYHLFLRPGHELIRKLGGVHKFMNWNGPILTDSGGYQAYSMADLNSVDDEGVTFRSIIDGSVIRFTPERAMEVQDALGSDIIMAFDDCPPSQGDASQKPHNVVAGPRVGDAGAGTPSNLSSVPDPRLSRVLKRDRVQDHAARLDIANERTVRWLERCKASHARPEDQALFGIVQGGTDLARRAWSAERITNIDLPGYAIGGVAVGESSADIARVVRHTAPLLPRHKPRYLMGVGYERDLLAGALAGVDMFDCVLPTRNGRNANAFTPQGQIRLRNAKHAEDASPIDATCDCLACAGGAFSRAYLRHLFMADEMLGPILTSLHNIRHFQRFMSDVRSSIVTGAWKEFGEQWPCAVGSTSA